MHNLGTPTQEQLRIKNLGPCTIRSPIEVPAEASGEPTRGFVPDSARVIMGSELLDPEASTVSPLGFEKAGARGQIFFEPGKTRAAIVTAGGLSPGLNNVIRSIVLELHFHYGVQSIVGFRYGYAGLDPKSGLRPMDLGPDEVRDIHRDGGSILGVGRGPCDTARMAETLRNNGIDILFTIGGDGTLRGAHKLAEEIERRGEKIAVVGIPKTIDNDVPFVDRTFGFDTAVEIARQALDAAHAEAISAQNGVGLVRLMGRDSGFIAAFATLASLDVNFCLVPEVPFDLHGPGGLLWELERRLAARGHAVIVVAEGCAKALLTKPADKDESGNTRYSAESSDVGPWLSARINEYFRVLKKPLTLKYIDPSYMIRSVPANASDSLFCDLLARHAVHAAMAGKTDLMIGRWHSLLTHVPLTLTAHGRKTIDPFGSLWLAVRETTGQPRLRAST